MTSLNGYNCNKCHLCLHPKFFADNDNCICYDKTCLTSDVEDKECHDGKRRNAYWRGPLHERVFIYSNGSKGNSNKMKRQKKNFCFAFSFSP